jgi:hypothetical protein
VDVLGVEALREGGETRDVNEEHGDELALAFEGALGGEDLLGKVLGRVAPGSAKRGAGAPVSSSF